MFVPRIVRLAQQNRSQMLGCPWLTIAGLSVDVAGVLVIASAAVVTRKKALQRGMAYLAYETPEEDLKLPPVRHILAESRRTVWGLGLILAGFLLQILGSWP